MLYFALGVAAALSLRTAAASLVAEAEAEALLAVALPLFALELLRGKRDPVRPVGRPFSPALRAC